MNTAAAGNALDAADEPFAEVTAQAVSGLKNARTAWRDRQRDGDGRRRFPSTEAIAVSLGHLAAALFPVRLGGFRGDPTQEDPYVADELRAALPILHQEIANELGYWQSDCAQNFDTDQPDAIVRLFALTLPEIRSLIDSDVDAAFVGDPAALSADEILISYPGALAMLHHRIAHQLHDLGAPLVARVISELANARTGIDIHPGAMIGPRFFIDHGTGVVIGETAIIGANVRLYQHVTLGARSPLGLASVGPRERYARHPIVQDDVIVYAGATILGRVTIGRGSIIGGNVWLLEDVPPNSIVLQPEACIVRDSPAADELAAGLRGRAG
jgi:serine O-acetyltransferase